MKKVKNTVSASQNRPYLERKFERIQSDAKILAGRLQTFYRDISSLPDVDDYLDSYDVDAINRTIETLRDVSLGVVLEK